MAKLADGPYDIVIVGAGILGVTIANWLSEIYDCSLALIDLSGGVAQHTSTRNTGVIHRPFYLDPETRRVFATCAELSYPLWRQLSEKFELPWRQVGTLEVALHDEELSTVRKYKTWGERNGVPEGELDVLDSAEVRALEPEVRCEGAIHSKTDVSVDFGAFTRAVFNIAQSRGVRLLGETKVVSVGKLREGGHSLRCMRGSSTEEIQCRYLINAAGGGAIDIAHMMGVGDEYTDLHFRGDYWLVDEPFSARVGRNIYSVARHPQFLFLDPHFVVRADGTRQIGPNAALVDGPFTYEGFGVDLVGKLLERPVLPKLKLFSSGTFLSLVWTEWRSSVSKGAMCARVQNFLPNLRPSLLGGRGLSGVRSSVIDGHGFVPEALQLEGEESFHVLNYNSPGATGAPVFSAIVVNRLREAGIFQSLPEKTPKASELWEFGAVIADADRRNALR